MPRAIEHAQIETKWRILYWGFLHRTTNRQYTCTCINSSPIHHLVQYFLHSTVHYNPYYNSSSREVVDQILQRQRDMMSRYIVGCEDPPVVSSPTSSTSASKDPPSILPTSTPKPAAVTPPISPLPTPTHVLTTPTSPVPPPPVSSSSFLPTSVGSIPQKILPSFLLKRFSMPTLLKKSPDKRENLLSSFPNVESIPEHPPIATPTSLAPPTLIPGSSVTLTTPTTTPVLQSYPTSTQSNPPTLINTKTTPTFSPADVATPTPINNNANTTSTKGRHNRSHSMDYSYQPQLQRTSVDSSMSFGSQWSVESISLLSENPSELSYETAYTAPLSPVHPPADTSRCGCFQFKAHFSLFSQYTSNLALEYNNEDEGKGEELSHRLSSLTPPIWCLDALNGTAAVGCGNGQIEVR